MASAIAPTRTHDAGDARLFQPHTNDDTQNTTMRGPLCPIHPTLQWIGLTHPPVDETAVRRNTDLRLTSRRSPVTVAAASHHPRITGVAPFTRHLFPQCLRDTCIKPSDGGPCSHIQTALTRLSMHAARCAVETYCLMAGLTFYPQR